MINIVPQSKMVHQSICYRCYQCTVLNPDPRTIIQRILCRCLTMFITNATIIYATFFSGISQGALKELRRFSQEHTSLRHGAQALHEFLKSPDVGCSTSSVSQEHTSLHHGAQTLHEFLKSPDVGCSPSGKGEDIKSLWFEKHEGHDSLNIRIHTRRAAQDSCHPHLHPRVELRKIDATSMGGNRSANYPTGRV